MKRNDYRTSRYVNTEDFNILAAYENDVCSMKWLSKTSNDDINIILMKCANELHLPVDRNMNVFLSKDIIEKYCIEFNTLNTKFTLGCIIGKNWHGLVGNFFVYNKETDKVCRMWTAFCIGDITFNGLIFDD